MLSYLKEDTLEQDKEQAVDAPVENEVQSETTQDEDYLESSVSEKPAKKTTVILAGVVIVGAIALFLMIKQVAPASLETANKDQMAIDIALSQLSSGESLTKQIDSVVKKFYDFSNVPQIGAKWLHKNPFVLSSKLISSENGTGSKNEKSNVAARKNHVDIADTLNVYGVMNISGKFCCMIDDKLLYEGDRYKDFTISKISNQSVVITKDGKNISIKIDNAN